jgi:hypothetical protein
MEKKTEFITKVEQIKNALLSNFIEEGLPGDCVLYINLTNFEIGLKEEGRNFAFASEVTIYTPNYFRNKYEISYGSSGAFTPEDKAAVHRTFVAAWIINNWAYVCGELEAATQAIKTLKDQIK